MDEFTFERAGARRRAAPRLYPATLGSLLAVFAVACASGEAARAGGGPAGGATASPADTQVAPPPLPLQTPPGAERGPDVIFVPTPDSVVVAMLRVAEVTEDDLVYDLGSGDGRIVIAAAKRFGARGVGIDIDPQRVAEARANAEREGVEDRVEFLQADLFESDIGDATVVTLYLLSELNRRLRPRLFAQLEAGTPVVSHGFDMGEWKPDSTFQVEHRHVYFWVVPANVGGTWTWDTGGRRPREGRLELEQKFQEVTGTTTLDGTTFELSAELRGDSLRFTAQGAVDGEQVSLRFTGRAREDELEGIMEVEGGPFEGREEWTARRQDSQETIAPTDSADVGRWETS